MIKQKHKRYIKRVFLFFLLLIIVIVGNWSIQNINFFHDPRETYEIWGVDVSHYQGKIDWEKMKKNGIQFAFIKATEGSSSQDERFFENYRGAVKQNITIGAYHFFSFDSKAETQADNFINTVPREDTMLPPVIDIEFYADKEKNPPEKEKVQKELNKLLILLEQIYEKKPILYTTMKVYNKYIKGNYKEYPLWIRNVYFNPTQFIGRDWTFWQYSDTELLDGYQGIEKYIDCNVFYGTKEEWSIFCNGF